MSDKNLAVSVRKWVERFFEHHHDTVRSYEEFLPLSGTMTPIEKVKFKDPQEYSTLRVTAQEFSVKWSNQVASDEEAILSLGATLINGFFPLGLPKETPIPGSTLYWRALPEYAEFDEYDTGCEWKKIYLRCGWYYMIGS